MSIATNLPSSSGPSSGRTRRSKISVPIFATSSGLRFGAAGVIAGPRAVRVSSLYRPARPACNPEARLIVAVAAPARAVVIVVVFVPPLAPARAVDFVLVGVIVVGLDRARRPAHD